MQTPTNKYVYIPLDDGVMFRRPIKDQDKSVSSKLENLRNLVVKYAKYNEEKFNNGIIEFSKIEEKKMEWIESTIRYYEVNYGDSLDSIIAFLEFKISKIEQEKSLVKTK